MKFALALVLTVTAQGAGPFAVERLDGSSLTVRNFAEHRATVVVFLSARDQAGDQVPVLVQKLNHQWRQQKVLFVGVFPNPAETAAEVRAYCQFYEFMLPCYRDPRHVAVKALGAAVTPEAFLLDSQGATVFHASVDQLEGALTLFMSGQAPGASAAAAGTPIDRPGPPRKLKELDYVSFSSELIFERIPDAPAHHASTMTLAQNGDLLVTWYGGSYESSDDEALFLSRRVKGQRGWSVPEMLVRNPTQMVGNAVIFTLADGTIWIIWGRMEATQPLLSHTGWASTRLMVRTSKDHGHTWSADAKFPMDTMGWLPRNLAVRLQDGSTLVPVSDERNERDLSFVLLTKDNGKTWTKSGTMPNPGSDGEQPAVAQRPDGSLLAFLRTKPYLLRTESRDGGLSWSEAQPTTLKNPNAAISLTTLRNGHMLLVWNNTVKGREQLHLARSLDHGKTWGEPLLLESNPGEFSYPSTLQTPDGQIHIIYTYRRYAIKHVEINENWIDHLDREQ